MIKVVLLTVLVAMAIERMRLTENHGDGDAYGAYPVSEQNDDDGHGGGCSDDGYAGGGCTRDTDDDGDRNVLASWEGGTDGDYEDVRVGNADDGANPGSEADGVCVTHGDADDLVVGRLVPAGWSVGPGWMGCWSRLVGRLVPGGFPIGHVSLPCWSRFVGRLLPVGLAGWSRLACRLVPVAWPVRSGWWAG